MTAPRAEVQGLLARIERLAVHDGPGIRTVVFLKGCPLHCDWCASPDTQSSHPELYYDGGRCIRCGVCLDVCPQGTVSIPRDGVGRIDRTLCVACGRCADVCPTGARRLVGRTATVAEVLAEIEKDEVFYYRSGGGVTLGGGEPLAQPVFAAGIVKACARRGIHTALETSAHAPWQRLDALLGALDLVYVDIKHMDDAVHRRVTGAGNRLVLENTRKLAQGPQPPDLILRVPVIPGVNDSIENIQQTAAFARELERILRVELLPYHRYGLHRYPATGRLCSLKGLEAPSTERMRALAAVMEAQGIPVRIGG